MVERVDRRQGAAGRGAGADRGPHRRGAAVRRGADQGGARAGPARGRGRPLRARRAAAAARDPGDAAGLADGPARPPGAGQGGGAGRRRASAASSRTSCWPRSPALPERRAASTRSAQLVAAELVFRRGAPPEAGYVFKHALVQDAAYGSLLKSRRQQLHARIAQVAGGALPGDRRDRARAARAPLHRGGAGGARRSTTGCGPGSRALARSATGGGDRASCGRRLELARGPAATQRGAGGGSSTCRLALGSGATSRRKASPRRKPGAPTRARASCASESATTAQLSRSCTGCACTTSTLPSCRRPGWWPSAC